MESHLHVSSEALTRKKWVCPAVFDLDCLEANLRSQNPQKGDEFFIDFSATSWFDIAALAFLLCILSNLKSQVASVGLRLPDVKKHEKARDFLHRWNFKGALELSLNRELANILPSDQLDYFDAPQTSYNPSSIINAYGDLTVLSSLRLLEILSLTHLCEDGNFRVSPSLVAEITDRTSSKAIYTAIQHSIGATREWATKFGRVLIHQALLNAFEHPEATVAFMAMAYQDPYLVIGIADNGMTIPHTISSAYADYAVSKRHEHALASYELDANRIAYSTFKGTSRLKRSCDDPSQEIGDPDRGMGLYYIKQLVAEVGGSLIIRASEASVRFKQDGGRKRVLIQPRPVARLAHGNLLKIFLPLKNPASSRRRR